MCSSRASKIRHRVAALRRSFGRQAGTRARRSKSCNVKRGGAKASANTSPAFKASSLAHMKES